MFVITLGDTKYSDEMLEEIKSYQIELFSGLNLHLRVLNMSSQELGSPAFMKYDIEAWMPGNQFYGEVFNIL
jgi:seryl-tRNA synthetase